MGAKRVFSRVSRRVLCFWLILRGWGGGWVQCFWEISGGKWVGAIESQIDAGRCGYPYYQHPGHASDVHRLRKNI